MKRRHLLFLSFVVVAFTSCVSRKQLKSEQDKYAKLNSFYMQVQDDLKKCRDDEAEASRRKALLETEIAGLNKQIDFLKENNNTVVNQLKDLSVISSSQAESIKKSLDNISSKDNYIQGLQSALAKKDSLNMALVMNLKGALNDVNDSDVEIKV
jgi:chemotaxis protein MotB